MSIAANVIATLMYTTTPTITIEANLYESGHIEGDNRWLYEKSSEREDSCPYLATIDPYSYNTPVLIVEPSTFSVVVEDTLSLSEEESLIVKEDISIEEETVAVEDTNAEEEFSTLQDNKTVEEEKITTSGVTATTIGGMGTLVFANGAEFPMYYADGYGDASYSQQIVNNWNSAVWEAIGGNVLIADHSSQGFSIMKSYGVGSVAYIVHDGWTDTIQCVSYYPSVTWGNGKVTLPDGRDAMLNGDSSLIMQTCNNSSGTNVTISYWQYI